MWSEKYGKDNEPAYENIGEFIDNDLWQKLNNYLREAYNISPKIAYSGCSMQNGYWKGWNIKYKKSGKSLCTVYPKQGWFAVLVTIGAGEMSEVELLMPQCSEYTQELFKQTVQSHNGGKSLAFEVKSEDILEDVKGLFAIRANNKK